MGCRWWRYGDNPPNTNSDNLESCAHLLWGGIVTTSREFALDIYHIGFSEYAQAAAKKQTRLEKYLEETEAVEPRACSMCSD